MKYIMLVCAKSSSIKAKNKLFNLNILAPETSKRYIIDLYEKDLKNHRKNNLLILMKRRYIKLPDDVDDMDVGEYYKLLCVKNANLAVKDELLKQLKKNDRMDARSVEGLIMKVYEQEMNF